MKSLLIILAVVLLVILMVLFPGFAAAVVFTIVGLFLLAGFLGG